MSESIGLPTLLTAHELAGLLRLKQPWGHKTIEKWMRAGRLKTLRVRVGKHWLFKTEKVMEQIERGGIR